MANDKPAPKKPTHEKRRITVLPGATTPKVYTKGTPVKDKK